MMLVCHHKNAKHSFLPVPVPHRCQWSIPKGKKQDPATVLVVIVDGIYATFSRMDRDTKNMERKQISSSLIRFRLKLSTLPIYFTIKSFVDWTAWIMIFFCVLLLVLGFHSALLGALWNISSRPQAQLTPPNRLPMHFHGHLKSIRTYWPACKRVWSSTSYNVIIDPFSYCI